ncbi:S ribonuclease [Pyrus ussuriensis x Pyrus communis]|uniref:S ribonuclease n=1 Tax=Pyrus ussuriensis x Pyrus communis TaxID=2448454 RepID=A0A5N5GWS1_9ROSA|nr:S ribonuclease [Pyrus ussuriensis x Pyrus communis]
MNLVYTSGLDSMESPQFLTQRSSNDEEKAIVFVASVDEEHLSVDEHELDDPDVLTYD